MDMVSSIPVDNVGNLQIKLNNGIELKVNSANLGIFLIYYDVSSMQSVSRSVPDAPCELPDNENINDLSSSYESSDSMKDHADKLPLKGSINCDQTLSNNPKLRFNTTNNYDVKHKPFSIGEGMKKKCEDIETDEPLIKSFSIRSSCNLIGPSKLNDIANSNTNNPERNGTRQIEGHEKTTNPEQSILIGPSSLNLKSEGEVNRKILCVVSMNLDGSKTSIDHLGARIRHNRLRLDISLSDNRRVRFDQEGIKFCRVDPLSQEAMIGYSLDHKGLGMVLETMPPMSSPPDSSFSSTSLLYHNDDDIVKCTDRFKTDVSCGNANQRYSLISSARTSVLNRLYLNRIRKGYELLNNARTYEIDELNLRCIIIEDINVNNRLNNKGITGIKISQDIKTGEVEINDISILPSLSSRRVCLIPLLNKVWLETSYIKASVESKGIVSIKLGEKKVDASPLRLTVNNQRFASGFAIEGELFIKKLR